MEAATIFSIPAVSNIVGDAVVSLQLSLNSVRAHITPLVPMHASEYLAFNANIPTEQEWSDQEIVEQVQEELKQTEADIQGKILYDNKDDKDKDEPHNDTSNKFSTLQVDSPVAVLVSIDALKSFISQLGDPGLNSNIVQLDSLCQQIASFGV